MVNLLLTAISGFLVFAAFKPIGLWWLAPLGFALHIFILNRTSRRVLSVAVFALTINLLLLHWTSIYVGSLPWIILAAGMTVFYLPLALVHKWGIASYPLIFIILEELRNRFPFGGFGWARIAYSQADAPYASIARYGGATALSAMVLMIGLFIYFSSIKKIKIKLLLPVLLVFIPLSVNTQSLTSVLMIQGNVPKYGLDFNARAQAVFNNHVDQTRIALKEVEKVDFIVWPENAVDVDPFTNKKVFLDLESFTKPLIVGAIVRKESKVFNTSILWSDQGQQIYEKQHLTPFGEYIPWRGLASKISPYVDQVQDFSPGNSPQIFSIGSARISPIICYELLDDSIVANSAKTSNIMVVQTNNATFGTSAQSEQQMSITRIRAIEHSRNVVSVSTTGYSAFIDYRGKITAQTTMGTADFLQGDIGLIQTLSPRDRLGQWSVVISLIWLFLIARRKVT